MGFLDGEKVMAGQTIEEFPKLPRDGVKLSLALNRFPPFARESPHACTGGRGAGGSCEGEGCYLLASTLARAVGDGGRGIALRRGEIRKPKSEWRVRILGDSYMDGSRM